jgi:hypothetical protein
MTAEEFDKLDINNLKQNSFSKYSSEVIFDEKDFLNSYISPKKFKMKSFNISKSILMLNGTFFNLYDVEMKSKLRMSQVYLMKPNTRLKQMMKLTRNFHKLKESFEENSLLL